MRTEPGWVAHVRVLSDLLERLEASDGAGERLDGATAFARWIERTRALRAAGRTAFFVGNGASASMASHFAADAGKNGGLATQTFTDPALVTAVGNDLGYDQVFAEPLRRCGRQGDLLVAISSSGRSPNVVNAAHVGRERGVFVVSLTAMKPQNPLRGLGDLNLWVPATTYGLAETAHAAVLHYWMDGIALDA